MDFANPTVIPQSQGRRAKLVLNAKRDGCLGTLMSAAVKLGAACLAVWLISQESRNHASKRRVST